MTSQEASKKYLVCLCGSPIVRVLRFGADPQIWYECSDPGHRIDEGWLQEQDQREFPWARTGTGGES